MTFAELMHVRKSSRKMLPKPIAEEKLNLILEAGRLSPSASNRQPWKFVVVTDPDVLAEMAVACKNQPATVNAPVMIAVCSNLTHVMNCGHPCAPMDCAIASTDMLLQAAELGIFGCWLGNFDQELAKKAMNVPEDYTVYTVIPMGYPAEEPPGRPRKEMDEVVIRNKF